MKTALGVFAALVLAGATYIQPANAQPAPQGSYLNSCRNVGMDRDKLIADCPGVNGRWQRNRFEHCYSFRSCLATIFNYSIPHHPRI